jgi:GTP-binding protein HflX
MGTQRGNRGAMVRVALVGYTNVGKSTLMNRREKWCVCREQTFATLDTTVRKVVIKTTFLAVWYGWFYPKVAYATSWFFKSTLDEVRETDLLLHVVDISSEFEDHIASVNQTLLDIKANDKPVIMVLIKSMLTNI